MGVTHGPQKGLFLMVDLTLMCPEVLLPLQGSGSIMLNPQNYQDICIYTLEYALQIDKPKSGLIINAFHTAGNHPKCGLSGVSSVAWDLLYNRWIGAS